MEPTFGGVSDYDDTQYALSQEQRLCERNIRKYELQASCYAGVARTPAGKNSGEIHKWARAERKKQLELRDNWRRRADGVASKRRGSRRRDREAAQPRLEV